MPAIKPKIVPFPTKLSPMLATLVKEPFNDPDWVYEIKWDGYRIIAYVQNGKATLYSRGGQDYTSKYKAVANELSGLEDCVIDGEVVVFNPEGRPDFGALQNYQGKGDIAFYIFDLLYFDGESYLDKPLLQRKETLLHVITKETILHYSDHFDDGIALFEQMQKLNLEGIIAKQKESIYQPGKRSSDWLKIKISKRREYVIGGYSESKNTTSFRSILFGEYEDGKLKYVHHSGGGYTSKEKATLFKKFKELEIITSPFINPKDVIIDTKVHWINPDLVAEFEISDKTTQGGHIRHPAIFKGLREDKKPVEVVPEVAIKEPKLKPANPSTESQGSWEMVLNRKIESKNKLDIQDRTIELVNIERHIWHDITKADLIQYYISIADYIIPHLRDRPLGLNVSLYDPDKDFFLRGMENNAPKWATIFETDRKHKMPGKSAKIKWLVCNDLATLVWIVNLECIDVHPWGARMQNPNEPDYIAIDLDPSGNDFDKVIKTALAAKTVLEKHSIKSFVKTSGKTGMHIFIPCSGIEYGQTRAIAEKICQTIHEMVPDITTLSTSTNSRGDKVYVDPSQNDYADRLAAVYCVRAYHIPTVSTPLEWKEVKPGLDPAKFNIDTIGARLKKKGDLWADLLDKKTAVKNSKQLKAFYLTKMLRESIFNN